jgi:hypothetical protein
MSHYGSSSSVAVAGGMVEEPAKQFIAAPTFPSVGHSNSTSDVKQKQFESSFLAATSQFSLPFLDGVIDALRKLLRAEPLLDGECRNLSVLMEMTNLHLHLHYGHPLCNRNIGHDIINAVGYKGSDTVHAVVPLMNQGAVQSTLHLRQIRFLARLTALSGVMRLIKIHLWIQPINHIRRCAPQCQTIGISPLSHKALSRNPAR